MRLPTALVPPERLPPPTHDPEDVREAAEEVLSRPEFAEPPKSIYDRVLDALGDAINRVLSTLFEGGRSSVVAWIALTVVVFVIAFLIVKVARAVRRPPPGEPGFTVETDVRRPAVEWDEEAARHAAEGRWRDALRCRYRALVARLASAGAVDEIPGRTAGEYRREVGRTRPQVAPPFAEATDLFERAWYGHRPTGEDDDRRFRELAGRVLEDATP
ncbi:MAG TPA: DUF4129 domain-containing protein [Acidimicrobiales bacterium]